MVIRFGCIVKRVAIYAYALKKSEEDFVVSDVHSSSVQSTQGCWITILNAVAVAVCQRHPLTQHRYKRCTQNNKNWEASAIISTSQTVSPSRYVHRVWGGERTGYTITRWAMMRLQHSMLFWLLLQQFCSVPSNYCFCTSAVAGK